MSKKSPILAGRPSANSSSAKDRVLAAAYTMFSANSVDSVGIDSIIAAANEAQMRNGGGQPQQGQPRAYDANGQPIPAEGGHGNGNTQPPGLQEQPSEGEFEDAEQFPNA